MPSLEDVTTVCVEHHGKHRWVRNFDKIEGGFCGGLFEEKLDAILTDIRALDPIAEGYDRAY